MTNSQLTQEWLTRGRQFAEQPGAELRRIDYGPHGVPEEMLLGVLAELDLAVSGSLLRLTKSLPDSRGDVFRRIVTEDRRVTACRHVLASASVSVLAPSVLCAAHPQMTRCSDCSDAHFGEHDQRAAMTCDWCGAECFPEASPVVAPLGFIEATRSQFRACSFIAGPVVIDGLGACHSCRRRMRKTLRAVTDAVTMLESL